jgi:hypothetical protein
LIVDPKPPIFALAKNHTSTEIKTSTKHPGSASKLNSTLSAIYPGLPNTTTPALLTGPPVTRPAIALTSVTILIELPSQTTSGPLSPVTNAVGHEVTNPPISEPETTRPALSPTSMAVVTAIWGPDFPGVFPAGIGITQGAPPTVIDGTTISVPGQTPTVIGGETVLISSGVLYIGTAMQFLSTLAVGSVPTTPLVVGGVTFSVPPLVSPATNGSPLAVGGATVSYIPSASDVVIGTQTILPGSEVTISGTPVSLGPSGLVIGATTGPIPLETVAIPTPASSGPTGLGGVILSAFAGAPSSTSTIVAATTAATDLDPFLGSASSLQHNGVIMMGIILLGINVVFMLMI